ncbi:MAG TPA: hypothetical protein VFH11_06355 [Gemmatimonadota bacterium]|nr:hypothetical protein [Gemmatimonadota bacterium]
MRRRARLPSIALVAGLFLPAAIYACGDLLQEPDTGIATRFTITILSGDDQAGPAGTALPQPLRVRLTSLETEQVERLRVEWIVLEGNGRVEPPNSFTDEGGIAEATWILGSTPSRQRVTARFDGDFAVFEADLCEVCPQGD